jgi:FdrA protein
LLFRWRVGIDGGGTKRTLEECSLLAERTIRPETDDILALYKAEKIRLTKKAKRLKAKLDFRQCYVRGLFSGGTLCYEAQVIWKDVLKSPVHSNAPLSGELALPDATKSIGHTAVDLGEEEFTVGRPHPMIDNDLRIRRLLQEARDPETAVIMLDVVLGYGAHPNPAGELGPAILEARGLALTAGHELPVVVSVTGTEGDPQGLSDTISTLEGAGAIVCDSNAAAAQLTGMIVSH